MRFVFGTVVVEVAVFLVRLGGVFLRFGFKVFGSRELVRDKVGFIVYFI